MIKPGIDFFIVDDSPDVIDAQRHK